MMGFFQKINNKKKQIVKVSKHIRGHIASFSENTDTWSTNRFAAEMYGFRYNIGLFVFDFEPTTLEKQRAYQMGRIDFGIYDQNFSLEKLNDIAITRQGKEVTALSYRESTDDNKLDYLSLVFSGRNSPITSETLYEGFTDIDLIAIGNSTRFNYWTDMTQGAFLAGTLEEGLELVEQQATNAINNNGWYRSFMHWHWWKSSNNHSNQYFQKLSQTIGNNDVFSGSYSDIVEYYFVRESVDSITYDNGTISINYSKKYPNSPYNKITVPLWVEVDLSNTYFQGKNITTSHGGKIRSKGNNKYVIAIELDFTQTSESFTISEAETPNYINLNKPLVARNGNEITSDQPIKITLFSNLKSNPTEVTTGIEERQLTLGTNFTLATTLDTVNKNYFLGFINEEGVSGTVEF